MKMSHNSEFLFNSLLRSFYLFIVVLSVQELAFSREVSNPYPNRVVQDYSGLKPSEFDNMWTKGVQAANRGIDYKKSKLAQDALNANLSLAYEKYEVARAEYLNRKLSPTEFDAAADSFLKAVQDHPGSPSSKTAEDLVLSSKKATHELATSPGYNLFGGKASRGEQLKAAAAIEDNMRLGSFGINDFMELYKDSKKEPVTKKMNKEQKRMASNKAVQAKISVAKNYAVLLPFQQAMVDFLMEEFAINTSTLSKDIPAKTTRLEGLKARALDQLHDLHPQVNPKALEEAFDQKRRTHFSSTLKHNHVTSGEGLRVLVSDTIEGKYKTQIASRSPSPLRARRRALRIEKYWKSRLSRPR